VDHLSNNIKALFKIYSKFDKACIYAVSMVFMKLVKKREKEREREKRKPEKER
jgi:hypothetical protein